MTASHYLVVCPTPAGGHIEHAHDLAVGLSRSGAQSVVLLSRRGAVAYLGDRRSSSITYVEGLPDLPRSGLLRPARLVQYFLNLGREYIAIRRLIKRAGGSWDVVIEEPRYPWPRFSAKPSRTVLFLHNVTDHPTVGQGRAFGRMKAAVRDRCIQGVDLILVHGERQAHALFESTGLTADPVPLPGTSFLADALTDRQSESRTHGMTCLGEIRRDKGLEIAVEASRIAGLPISIIGPPSDPTYVHELSVLASAVPGVELHAEFLSAGEFSTLLETAEALVLPYTAMQGQSGVIARAMPLARRLILSDLPAFREQVAGYQRAEFFASGNADALAALMAAEPIGGGVKNGNQDRTAEDDWSRVVEPIVIRR